MAASGAAPEGETSSAEARMARPRGAAGRQDPRDLHHVPGEATLEFAPGRSLIPLACARLSETFGRRVLFKSGKNFAVSLRGQPPERVLDEVNNLLQIARFASKINTLPRP